MKHAQRWAWLCLLASCGHKQDTNEVASTIEGKVIYGDDNRLDLYQVRSPQVLALADSTVALIKASDLRASSTGYQISGETFGSAVGLCRSEPFYDQPTAAFCSGSLVGPNLILTAGHCIRDQSDCDTTRFVFGYGIRQEGAYPTDAPTGEVYSCQSVVHTQAPAAGADFAVVRLDRPVVGHAPLMLRRAGTVAVGDELTVIGHPVGLPTKVADGGIVRQIVGTTHLVASLDTYGGNSGSAVFDGSGQVAGVLVRGENDFENQGGCQISKRCAQGACRGEDVTLIQNVLDYVPEISPSPVPPPAPPPLPEPSGSSDYAATPELAIPDNSRVGIFSEIDVPEAVSGRQVVIEVDISHSWRGDLVLTLTDPSGRTRTLFSREGGSQDDLRGSFGLDLESRSSLASLSQAGAGRWRLRVMDRASQDVGVLHRWAVHLK